MRKYSHVTDLSFKFVRRCIGLRHSGGIVLVYLVFVLICGIPFLSLSLSLPLSLSLSLSSFFFPLEIVVLLYLSLFCFVLF